MLAENLLSERTLTIVSIRDSFYASLRSLICFAIGFWDKLEIMSTFISSILNLLYILVFNKFEICNVAPRHFKIFN